MRDQNAAAVRTLIDCIDGQRSILAGQECISSAPSHMTGGPFLYCQSSGSTGKARTIRRSQASWIASFDINRGFFDVGAGDCYALLGNLGHSLSLYGIVEALHLGADVLALGQDTPRAQLAAMRERCATVIFATPSQLRLLRIAAGQTVLPSVRKLFSGGGALGAEARKAVAALCPNAEILEIYGASETSFVTIANGASPPGSVGRAYPGVEVQLGSLDGERGEVWVRSPYLFDGYEVGESRDTIWRDGFLTVGEIGRMDQQGNLYLYGRKSRMVTVADVNVFLEDVEREMAAICGTRACAAIALPDTARGHAVIGFVEGKTDSLLDRRIREHCRMALGPLSTPRRICFVERMPFLPAGKPDLRALHGLAEGA